MASQQEMMMINNFERVRYDAKNLFQNTRDQWLEAGLWAAPHRVTWLRSNDREAQPQWRTIVDTTHIQSANSYHAGLLQGHTPPTRPWVKVLTSDIDTDTKTANYKWLEKFTKANLNVFRRSNFYQAASEAYSDYIAFDNAMMVIEERTVPDRQLVFKTLMPGSYYVINDDMGQPAVLVRDYVLTIKQIVENFAIDNRMSNLSQYVRDMYYSANYTHTVGVVQIIKKNEFYDPSGIVSFRNQPWISYTYESGDNTSSSGVAFSQSSFTGFGAPSSGPERKFIQIKGMRARPFVMMKGPTGNLFEYGQGGPTRQSLGLIKSLNKKALSKDEAIQKGLRPGLQGPKSLIQSNIAPGANSFVGLNSTDPAAKITPIYQVDPIVGALLQDVDDIRAQVGRLYYADYMLYLIQNPKTRTATETQAVMEEQRLAIGPVLQSLNYGFTDPLMDYVMDYTLYEDPTIEPPPPDLDGKFLKPEYISLFAQSQHSADLPAIENYLSIVAGVAQIKPEILDTLDVDRLADILQDRLFIPAGIRMSEDMTGAVREQRLAMREREFQIKSKIDMMKAMKRGQDGQGQQQLQPAA